MTLPSDQSHVWLPVDVTAYNGRGRQLDDVKSNFETRGGRVKIPWKANGKEGLQRVVFMAEDSWRQQTTCEFHVQLDGKQTFNKGSFLVVITEITSSKLF